MRGQFVHLLVRAYDIIANGYEDWVKSGRKEPMQFEISSEELCSVLGTLIGGPQYVRCIWFSPHEQKMGITCEYWKTTIDFSMQVRSGH